MIDNCSSQTQQVNNDLNELYCLSQNPLVRDGISQLQRLLKTLLPSYVAVDERSMKDLVGFVKDLGTQIQYYEFNGTSVVKDTWNIFFEITTEGWDKFDLESYIKKLKINKETNPHLALFFAFLYLFRIAQDDLNTITKRHLDFYYRDVLQLKENSAVPDQAAIIFNLAKNADTHLIKEGTKLKGGKDDTGVERIYKVQKDIVVNKAQISDLKALFANIHNRLEDDYDDITLSNDQRIYQSPLAKSSDGAGAKIENEELSWKTFGEPAFANLSGIVDVDREQPYIGFAIASPILFLAEGTRNIKLEFNFSPTISIIGLVPDHFVVTLSGEKDWIIAEEGTDDVTEVSATGSKLTIQRTLTAAQSAVVPYDEKVLLQPFKTKWPIIKVELNTKYNHDPFIYKALKDMQPSDVVITVDVDGVKDLILQNDNSILDPSKPFVPFSNRPFVGSKFYIGSWEVFQKELTSLEVKLKWNDLPNSSFATYYTNYDDIAGDETGPEPSTIRTNTLFKIDIKGLNGKIWENILPGADPVAPVALFTIPDGTGVVDAANVSTQCPNSKISSIDSSKLKGLGRDEKLEKFEAWDVNSQKGFIRFVLQGVDFGHSIFPNAYALQAIELSKEIPDVWAQLPNPPYTPSMQELSLNYVSSVKYEFDNDKASEENTEQFFYVEPYGVKEVTGSSSNHLFPQFDDEGVLYIGIKDLIPPQTLSILFQVAEGSANPKRDTQEVDWAILSKNEWVDFDDKTILSDTTNDLLTSGIISFSIPEEASKDNTILPSGSFWLRAAVTKESDAISKMIDIRTQAVLVKFSDNNNDPDHLRVALKDGSISKLLVSDSAIDKVEQPYASFGGEVMEESRDYYTRVSERLRHKRRAITIWDYEHLILQKFPSVYKVKCINHTKYEGTLENYSEMQPGHVTLIVVSNVQNKNAVDPLRPMTSLSMLDNIESYITELNPICAVLHVKNPFYEEVSVSFKVKFLADDFGYYRNKLEQEIKEFLSPWASGCSTDITFGGKIHKSVILNFVEERSYVDFVSCFKMYHTVPSDNVVDFSIRGRIDKFVKWNFSKKISKIDFTSLQRTSRKVSKNPNKISDKDIDEAIATTAISILGSGDTHTIERIDETKVGCDCPENEIINTNQIASADDCPCHEEITSLESKSSSTEENIDLT